MPPFLEYVSNRSSYCTTVRFTHPVNTGLYSNCKYCTANSLTARQKRKTGACFGRVCPLQGSQGQAPEIALTPAPKHQRTLLDTQHTTLKCLQGLKCPKPARRLRLLEGRASLASLGP